MKPWKSVLPDHGMQCQQKMTYGGRIYKLAVTLICNTSFALWVVLSLYTFPATPLWGILSLQTDASGKYLLCFHGISLLSGKGVLFNLSSSLLEFRILYLCCCDWLEENINECGKYYFPTLLESRWPISKSWPKRFWWEHSGQQMANFWLLVLLIYGWSLGSSPLKEKNCYSS